MYKKIQSCLKLITCSFSFPLNRKCWCYGQNINGCTEQKTRPKERSVSAGDGEEQLCIDTTRKKIRILDKGREHLAGTEITAELDPTICEEPPAKNRPHANSVQSYGSLDKQITSFMKLSSRCKPQASAVKYTIKIEVRRAVLCTDD